MTTFAVVRVRPRGISRTLRAEAGQVYIVFPKIKRNRTSKFFLLLISLCVVYHSQSQSIVMLHLATTIPDI